MLINLLSPVKMGRGRAFPVSVIVLTDDGIIKTQLAIATFAFIISSNGKILSFISYEMNLKH
jgi:hypothetical protein